jgi:hypothetical protein
MLFGSLVGFIDLSVLNAAFTYLLLLFLSLTPPSPLLQMIIRYLFETERPSGYLFIDRRILDFLILSPSLSPPDNKHTADMTLLSNHRSHR